MLSRELERTLFALALTECCGALSLGCAAEKAAARNPTPTPAAVVVKPAAKPVTETQPPCPDWGTLWNFDDPAASAQSFEAQAATAERRGDRHCQGQALTQVARALGLQRKFDEAESLLERAKSILPQDAHAGHILYLLESGRLQNSSGQPDDARPLFIEAYDQALAHGQDNLAVDAAHMVAITEIKTPDLAMEWNQKALRLAEASRAPQARRWLGSLYNNIGWTHFDRKEYAEALAMFERGVAFRKQAAELKPLLIARWSVGRVLRELGRVSEALELQRAVERDYIDNGLPPAGYVYE